MQNFDLLSRRSFAQHSKGPSIGSDTRCPGAGAGVKEPERKAV
jgi:hypothetical protein